MLTINDYPAAIFFIGKIGTICAGCYANISNYQEFPALQEFAFLKLMEELRRQGFKYFNFGGSEKETLFRFKEKFHPESFIHSNYIVYKNN